MNSIGGAAFAGCTSLTKVTIHARNVNISRRNAFDKGTKLTLRGYENSTVQKYAVSNNNRFEKITTSKLDAKAFSLKTTSYTRRYSSKSLTIRPKAAGKITYVSSNKKIAQVSSKGKITFRRKGTVKIKIKAAATSKYNATSRTITIKIK